MSGRDREVFFEIVVLGNYAKCSAIDAESGIEVSVMGPRATDRHGLQAMALKKLELALKKRDGKG